MREGKEVRETKLWFPLWSCRWKSPSLCWDDTKCTAAACQQTKTPTNKTVTEVIFLKGIFLPPPHPTRNTWPEYCVQAQNCCHAVSTHTHKLMLREATTELENQIPTIQTQNWKSFSGKRSYPEISIFFFKYIYLQPNQHFFFLLHTVSRKQNLIKKIWRVSYTQG